MFSFFLKKKREKLLIWLSCTVVVWPHIVLSPMSLDTYLTQNCIVLSNSIFSILCFLLFQISIKKKHVKSQKYTPLSLNVNGLCISLCSCRNAWSLTWSHLSGCLNSASFALWTRAWKTCWTTACSSLRTTAKRASSWTNSALWKTTHFPLSLPYHT